MSGDQFLTQFLRVQLAAEMLSAGAAQSGVRELRQALAQGATLEVAGYELHPEMAQAIAGLNLTNLSPATKRTYWLEVSPAEQPKLTPASIRVIESWQSKGLDVRATAVGGEPFWSTPEITESAALLEAMKGIPGR